MVISAEIRLRLIFGHRYTVLNNSCLEIQSHLQQVLAVIVYLVNNDVSLPSLIQKLDILPIRHDNTA